MKRLLVFVLAVLLLLVSGCSGKTGKRAEGDAAKNPANTDNSLDAAALFAAVNDTFSFAYDDGTPESDSVERWVRTADRVVAANPRGIYAVWQITRDGVYRRDPLAGPQGPYLRYLPAQLADNLTWQQTSGESKVLFQLKRNARCPGTYTGASRFCWELKVLNRGQLQAFYFQTSSGVVAATNLNIRRPADSYHKVLTGTGVSAQSLPTSDTLLHEEAVTAPFDQSQVPAVEPLTAEAFQAAVQQAIGPTVPLKPMKGTMRPTLYVVGGENGLRQQPPILLLDPNGEEWSRGEGGCQYTFQEALRFVFARCSGATDVDVRGWAWSGDAFEAVGWPGHLTVSDDWRANKAELQPNGDVITYESMADPAGHSRVETRRLDEQNNMSVIRTEYRPTGSALIYPKEAENVLYAAFFAHWFGLTAELPAYFANPDEITRQLPPQLDTHEWGGLTPWKIAVGQLQKVAKPGIHDAPVAIVSAPVQAGQPVDFLFTVGGCCDQVGWLWGKVTFARSGNMWQVANLTVQYSFKPGMKEPAPVSR